MPDRWMTYEQAGELFGLSAEAIRKRSRRLGWRIQAGNEGKSLVLVPDGAELQPAGRPGGRPAGDHPDELLAELRRRAETAEGRTRELAGEVAELRERAGRAEGEAAARRDAEARERARADAERQGREAAERELAEWMAGGPLARAWRALAFRRRLA